MSTHAPSSASRGNTVFSTLAPRPSSLRGFTLVEMLVVITIIGILAALGVPAIFSALKAAKLARIKSEITNLESAMQQFKTQYGDYPPSYFGDVKIDASSPAVDVTKDQHPVRRFLARACPRMNEPMQTWTDLKAYKMKPAQALVFWLYGFSKDPTLPLTGSGGPMSGGGSASPLFDFDRTRLIDPSTNATWVPPSSSIPVYKGVDGKQAYVYMDAKSYFLHSISVPTGTSLADPVCYPYLLEPWDKNNNGALDHGTSTSPPNDMKDSGGSVVPSEYQKICANPKSFQVISAGLDSDFGSSAKTLTGVPFLGSTFTLYYKSYPSGTLGYDPGGADDDNITNFSERPLGDAKP
jgi:type II secretion system protein G